MRPVLPHGSIDCTLHLLQEFVQFHTALEASKIGQSLDGGVYETRESIITLIQDLNNLPK